MESELDFQLLRSIALRKFAGNFGANIRDIILTKQGSADQVQGRPKLTSKPYDLAGPFQSSGIGLRTMLSRVNGVTAMDHNPFDDGHGSDAMGGLHSQSSCVAMIKAPNNGPSWARDAGTSFGRKISGIVSICD